MEQTLNLLRKNFESSSFLTSEFKNFFKVFKKEFKEELHVIGAENILFLSGHFYVSGFFTVKHKCYYFSTPDVRSFSETCQHFGSMLYRTVKNYKDYTGGPNKYVEFKTGMTSKMNLD